MTCYCGAYFTIVSALSVPLENTSFPLTIPNMHHDILIKKLLLTHDPDGRRLDSEAMLLAVGNIMFHTSTIIVNFTPLI